MRYNDSYYVNPLVPATSEELSFDVDADGLTLLEEALANTDPTSSDTDGDGLADGWEVQYHSSLV